MGCARSWEFLSPTHKEGPRIYKLGRTYRWIVLNRLPSRPLSFWYVMALMLMPLCFFFAFTPSGRPGPRGSQSVLRACVCFNRANIHSTPQILKLVKKFEGSAKGMCHRRCPPPPYSQKLPFIVSKYELAFGRERTKELARGDQQNMSLVCNSTLKHFSFLCILGHKKNISLIYTTF